MGFEARAKLVNIHEWVGVMLMFGVTCLAFGIGYFLDDAGYGFLLLAATLVYWFAVVRPSQRAHRERRDAT